MFRKLIAIVVLLLAASVASAQSTTVSGTVTDTPDGQTWNNGTVTATFSPGSFQPNPFAYTWTGGPLPQTVSGVMNGSGAYSLSIPSNTAITPIRSTWTFQFCPAATTQNCFTLPFVTVTGATQTLNAAPPSIRISMINPPPVVQAYADGEIGLGVKQGSQYFNLVSGVLRFCQTVSGGLCTVWSTNFGGGTPGAPPTSFQCNNASNFGACPGGETDVGGLITFPVTGNVALKAFSNDGVLFVSANGNDSNDCLSPGTACLTPFGAVQKLPQGSAGVAGVGTIEIIGNVNTGGSVANGGLWIIGNGDPNFASPPAGFLKWNVFAGQSLTFDCFSRISSGAHGHLGNCTLTGGGNTDSVHPSVWINGTNQPIVFNNINLGGFLNVYMKIGISSNNNRVTGAGSASLFFNGISWNHGSCRAGGGPGADIGNNSFWIVFNDPAISGCIPENFTIATNGMVRNGSGTVTVTTVPVNDVAVGDTVTFQNVNASGDISFITSAVVSNVVDNHNFQFLQNGPSLTGSGGQVVTGKAMAVDINPGSGGGSGLIFFRGLNNLNNGGIRLLSGTNGGGMYIERVSYEGDFVDNDTPAVLVANPLTTTLVKVDSAEQSDITTPVPDVRVDNGQIPSSVVVSRTDIGGTMGVITNAGGVVGDYSGTLFQGKTGNFNGRYSGNHDGGRRLGAPFAVQSPNLATTGPSGWGFQSGTGTITAGSRDVYSGANAGHVVATSNPAFVQFYLGSGITLNANDWWIAGVWVRSATSNGWVSNATPVKFVLNAVGFGANDFCVPTPNSINVTPSPPTIFENGFSLGEWSFFVFGCKIYSAPNTAGVSLLGAVDTTHSADFYGPVVMRFPAGTISDTEAYEIAAALSSFPEGIPAGTVSQMRGQLFTQAMGSSNFLMSHTPLTAFTKDRTIQWADVDGISEVSGYVNTVLDPFNRAGPGLGANWTTFGTAPQISGNQVSQAVNNQTVGAVWTATTFSPNQFAATTITSANAGAMIQQLYVRNNGTNTYGCTYEAGVNNTTIFKATPGLTTLATATTTPQIGDFPWCEVTGFNPATINFYVNGVKILTATDSSITTGQPGFALYQNLVGPITMDNWIGGNLHPFAHLDTEQTFDQPQHFPAVTVGTTAPIPGPLPSGSLTDGNNVVSLGSPCTIAELVLSAGWQSTGTATVTAPQGTGQTCSWTITTGTTTAANPTITDTLTNPLISAAVVCELNIHGGTHTAVAGEGFQQTTLSATAPVFTLNGTPTAGGTTYFVTRRCGP